MKRMQHFVRNVVHLLAEIEKSTNTFEMINVKKNVVVQEKDFQFFGE